MASPFMLKPGCYDHVYQISGAIQQFITKCVAGGRVMTNSNKQYHVKNKIADFDVCSLYPYAMYFMEGFVKGLPNALSDTSYEFLKQQDGYFVRTQIIKLNTVRSKKPNRNGETNRTEPFKVGTGANRAFSGNEPNRTAGLHKNKTRTEPNRLNKY